jgi:hypothetical protein
MSILWKRYQEKCGTEEFWVPAVLAAVSAGGQAINQQNANKRQQTAEVQAIGDQDQLREQANSQVKNLTQQIAQNTPQQLQAKEEGDFVNTLRKNQAGSGAANATSNAPNTNFGAPVGSLGATAGASSRYKSDTANAQQQVQAYGNTNAEEESAVDSAVRQRQNEGLAMNTLGTNLNSLAAKSYQTNFVDQLRAQTQGQANPWVSLFSSVLGNGANAYSKDPTMFKAQNPGTMYSQYSPGGTGAASGVDFISG